MSGLAKFLLKLGKNVAGSDILKSRYTDELASLGVEIDIANDRSVKDFDVVVFTDAIKDSDIQLAEARALNKYVLSRGQLLYEVSRIFKRVIAISGCHGKTTCTSMLAHIFDCANIKFCAHIGGIDLKYSNMYYTGRDFFITEACEYKKNFLLLKPDIAVVLNSDADHLECYGSKEKLVEAYNRFAASADVNIYLYGDLKCDGITFGYGKNARYHATKVSANDGRYSFNAYEYNKNLGKMELNVYGKHNVLNALAAIAAARTAGIGAEEIRAGLKSFTGIERRFETIGRINGAVCIADYAHHPNELKSTLAAAKVCSNGELYVVFQPHTYSRTKNLFKDFVKVLSQVSNLLIFRTFAAREYFDDEGSALTLSQSLKRSEYGDDPRDVENFIGRAKDGDIVLFLGAGDIYDIAKRIVANLN